MMQEAEYTGSEKGLTLARYVMGNLVRDIQVDPDLFQYWLLPAAEFSGDVVAARMTAGQQLHVILGDGTGHGLATALCMMPVSEIFYAMTGKGFPIGSIAKELNKKMHALLPRDRFIAATLVSVNPANRTIEVWNGGGPAAFFVSEDGQYLQEWKSNHLPIGVLPDDAFDEKVSCYQWDQPGQLFLYSDGLIDARDQGDAVFGVKCVQKYLLETKAENRFEGLKKAVLDHVGKAESLDDISLVMLNCHLGFQHKPPQKNEDQSKPSKGPREWKVALRLNESDIKNLDVLPILLTWLKQADISQRDTQRLFLILSELYTNAVDHGLLGLDSSLKSSSSGFEGYLNLRSERLHTLSEGQVDITMERTFQSEKALIKIRIEDSGSGFEHQDFSIDTARDSVKPSGKGISLIHSLSSDVHYVDPGNIVEVTYALTRDE